MGASTHKHCNMTRYNWGNVGFNIQRFLEINKCDSIWDPFKYSTHWLLGLCDLWLSVSKYIFVNSNHELLSGPKTQQIHVHLFMGTNAFCYIESQDENAIVLRNSDKYDGKLANTNKTYL